MIPLFITFEGVEGCGKTTQARLLRDYMRSQDIQVYLTREPGGTDIGNYIRSILLNPDNVAISSLTELLLYEASRAQLVHEIIRPYLDNGIHVLCDRYSDSSTVYQGIARGIDIDQVQYLNMLATNGLSPDITFLLDIDAETGLMRAKQRLVQNQMQAEEARFENEALAFHQKTRDGFLKLAKENIDRFKIINAHNTPSNIQTEIIRHLRGLL